MGAAKSQYLHSASWGPRRANDVDLVPESSSLRFRKSCFSSSLKAEKSWWRCLKVDRQEEFPLMQGWGQPCYSIQAWKTDWIRHFYIIEGNLLHSVNQFQYYTHLGARFIRYMGSLWPSQVDTTNEPWQTVRYFTSLCSVSSVQNSGFVLDQWFPNLPELRINWVS